MVKMFKELSSGRTAEISLLSVVFIWAAGFPLVGLAVAEVDPLVLSFYRFLGAAIACSIVCVATGVAIVPHKSEAWSLAISGVLQIGAMSTFSALGLVHCPPGKSAVIVYSMPVWASIIGFLFARERLSVQQTLGIICGFAGILLLISSDAIGVDASPPWGGLSYLFLAALSWAAGSVLFRHSKPYRTSYWTIVVWQLFVSAFCVGLFMVIRNVPFKIRITGGVLAALTFHWTLGSAAAYWLWSRALVMMPAALAGQYLLLVPVLTILMSWGDGNDVSALGWLGLAVLGVGVFFNLRSPPRLAA